MLGNREPRSPAINLQCSSWVLWTKENWYQNSCVKSWIMKKINSCIYMAFGEETIALLLIPCSHSWPGSRLIDDRVWTSGARERVASPTVSVKKNKRNVWLEWRVTEVGSVSHQLVRADERGSEGYHVTGNRIAGIKAYRWQSVAIQVHHRLHVPRVPLKWKCWVCA